MYLGRPTLSGVNFTHHLNRSGCGLAAYAHPRVHPLQHGLRLLLVTQVLSPRMRLESGEYARRQFDSSVSESHIMVKITPVSLMIYRLCVRAIKTLVFTSLPPGIAHVLLCFIHVYMYFQALDPRLPNRHTKTASPITTPCITLPLCFG